MGSGKTGPHGRRPDPSQPEPPGRSLHPAAVRLIAEIRASGEFTTETWQRLFDAMDELADDDLAAVLEEIGRTVAKPTGRQTGQQVTDR